MDCSFFNPDDVSRDVTGSRDYRWACACGKSIRGNTAGVVIRAALNHLMEAMEQYVESTARTLDEARARRAERNRETFKAV